MPIDTAVLLTDFEAVRDDLPITVTFRGVSATASKSTLDRQTLFEDAGSRGQYRFSIFVSDADWGEVPESQDKVEIDLIEYRVMSTDTGPDGNVTRFDLTDKYGR